MGNTKQKTDTSSQSNSTMTPTATPEETALNKMFLSNAQELNPQSLQVQHQGLDLVSKLLGGQPLPGYLNTLPGGISEEVTGSIVNQSLKDLNGQLARSGAGSFLESGASQAVGTRAAADIRNQAAQFNLNNLMQLLNIGVGGQASVQAPIAGYSSQLSQNLAGLRSVNQTGTSSGTSTFTHNPFLESFYNGLGKSTSNFSSGFGSGFAQALAGGM